MGRIDTKRFSTACATREKQKNKQKQKQSEANIKGDKHEPRQGSSSKAPIQSHNSRDKKQRETKENKGRQAKASMKGDKGQQGQQGTLSFVARNRKAIQLQTLLKRLDVIKRT